MENAQLLKPPNLNSGYPPSPSFQLYEFRWINLHYLPETSLDDFWYVSDWLFGRSPRGPRVFGLDERNFAVEKEVLRRFLERYGKDRVSLVTPAEVGCEDIRLSDLCPVLRELILHCTNLPSLEARSTIPIVHLEHLGCKIPGSPDQEPLIKTVDWLATLPNLRCVTLFAHNNRPEPKSYYADEWQKRFQNKISSQVSVVADEFVDRRDLIRADRFPQDDGTLSNFKYMVNPSSSSLAQ